MAEAAGRGDRGGRGGRGKAQPVPPVPPPAPTAPEPSFLATLIAFRYSPNTMQGLTNNMLLSTQYLVGLMARDIEKIMKIVRTGLPIVAVTYLAEKNLTILTYWVNRRH
jgi:hypothetical protein